MSHLGRSATETAASVAAGEVTAVSVIEEHLAAISDAASLNAFTLVETEAAGDRAADIDRRRRAGETLGPLAGVPIALKDLIDHAGRVTTCGSSFYRRTPEHSAPIVERLEAADAVIVGRTGLHEFAFGFSSENDWFGPVRNPWDPETSPGGSSGGSAAAVAARLAPIGIGTDTGGSVRVPAALCGVMGLKVTHGRIPLRGVFPLAPSLDTVGPLATTAADLDLAYRVMAGDDPGDPWTAPQPVVAAQTVDPATLRIAVPTEWLDGPLDAGTRAGFSAAVERLAALGAELGEVSEPLLRPPGMINEAAQGEIAVVHREWFAESPDRYGRAIRSRLEAALGSDLTTYTRALEWRAAIRHAVERLMTRWDLIATPAVAAGPKRIGDDRVVTESGDVGYRQAFSWFSALVNHAGNPAIVVPLDADGAPPPSLQLIGPRWAEPLLLGTGVALEEAGLAVRRPPPQGSPR